MQQGPSGIKTSVLVSLHLQCIRKQAHQLDIMRGRKTLHWIVSSMKLSGLWTIYSFNMDVINPKTGSDALLLPFCHYRFHLRKPDMQTTCCCLVFSSHIFAPLFSFFGAPLCLHPHPHFAADCLMSFPVNDTGEEQEEESILLTPVLRLLASFICGM